MKSNNIAALFSATSLSLSLLISNPAWSSDDEYRQPFVTRIICDKFDNSECKFLKELHQYMCLLPNQASIKPEFAVPMPQEGKSVNKKRTISLLHPYNLPMEKNILRDYPFSKIYMPSLDGIDGKVKIKINIQKVDELATSIIPFEKRKIPSSAKPDVGTIEKQTSPIAEQEAEAVVAKNKKNDSQKKIIDLEIEQEKLRQEQEVLHQKVQQNTQHIDELKEDLKAAQCRIEDLMQERQNTVVHTEAEAAKAREQNVRIKELEQEIMVAQADADNIRLQLDDVKRERANAQQLAESRQTKIDELTREFQEARQEMTLVREEDDNIRHQLEEIERERDNAQQLAEELQIRIAELEREKNDLEQLTNTKDNQIDVLTREFQEKRQERDTAQQLVEELQIRIAELEREKNDLVQHANTKDNQIEALTRERDDLEEVRTTERNEMRRERDNVKTDLEEAQIAYQGLLEEIAALQNEVARLQTTGPNLNNIKVAYSSIQTIINTSHHTTRPGLQQVLNLLQQYQQ
jgi:chromosome segregation protein